MRLLHYYWSPKIKHHRITAGISIFALMNAFLIIDTNRGFFSKTLSSNKFPIGSGIISIPSIVLLLFLFILFILFFDLLLVFKNHILESILVVVSLFLNIIILLLSGDKIQLFSEKLYRLWHLLYCLFSNHTIVIVLEEKKQIWLCFLGIQSNLPTNKKELFN
jgi:hypothetical protein